MICEARLVYCGGWQGGSAISSADGHTLIQLKVLWLQTPAL